MPGVLYSKLSPMAATGAETRQVLWGGDCLFERAGF